MEKFSINSSGIKGSFYPDEDFNKLYNILCHIKDVLEFAKERPNHERTPKFLEKGINDCMEIFEILKIDNRITIK